VERAAFEGRLAEVHRGKKWILVSQVAVGATEMVETLKEWGAPEVLVLAGVEGVGDLPDVPVFYTRTSGSTMMAGFRAFEFSIANPSADLTAAIDEFDPDHEALVLNGPFSVLTEVTGRPVYGPRPPAQAALEDKMVADDIWDSSGIARAPSEVVLVADAVAAARRLAGLLGSVWVADNKEGWHGGADYVRWVRTEEDEAAAVSWYASRADHVRVMPFLDGIPCSIHGWVTQNGIAVTRPMEMIVLRRLDRTGFVHAGYANYWDPPQELREAMRAAARAVGQHLIERVGYRGPFGIDGVLTPAGFRPTELNPRVTAGHMLPADAAGLMAEPLARAELAGDLELDAEWLEETLLTAGDRQRGGRALMSFADPLPDRRVEVAFVDGKAEVVDEEHSHANMGTGTSPQGGIVLVGFHREGTPHGPSVAPLAVAALDLARKLWDLPIPPLEPSPDLFASGSQPLPASKAD
jgi:D-alanine-D-alanine ligase-like ATP-grasp enzyme